MHGGVVSHLINDIDITCLASNLPEYLEVDVEALDIGDSIFLSALNLPEGVEIPSLALGEDRDQAVVSVAEAKILEIEPEVVEPEEGEEGEEGVEGEEGAETEADSEDSGGDSKDSEEKSE
jgi:large subunit ribosomal protein L25